MKKLNNFLNLLMNLVKNVRTPKFILVYNISTYEFEIKKRSKIDYNRMLKYCQELDAWVVDNDWNHISSPLVFDITPLVNRAHIKYVLEIMNSLKNNKITKYKMILRKHDYLIVKENIDSVKKSSLNKIFSKALGIKKMLKKDKEVDYYLISYRSTSEILFCIELVKNHGKDNDFKLITHKNEVTKDVTTVKRRSRLPIDVLLKIENFQQLIKVRRLLKEKNVTSKKYVNFLSVNDYNEIIIKIELIKQLTR